MASSPVLVVSGGPCSSIHLTAVSNSYNKDAQSAVLEGADDSIITYAVLPELAQLGAFKGFADAAWIVEYGHTLTQKSCDASSNLLIQFS